MSRMSPRKANSPGSSMVVTRWYPPSTRNSANSARSHWSPTRSTRCCNSMTSGEGNGCIKACTGATSTRGRRGSDSISEARTMRSISRSMRTDRSPGSRSRAGNRAASMPRVRSDSTASSASSRWATTSNLGAGRRRCSAAATAMVLKPHRPTARTRAPPARHGPGPGRATAWSRVDHVRASRAALRTRSSFFSVHPEPAATGESGRMPPGGRWCPPRCPAPATGPMSAGRFGWNAMP